MDRSNLRDIQRLQQRHLQGRKGSTAIGSSGSKAKVCLFGDFVSGSGEGEEVDDPYYGGQEGFDATYEQCVRFSKGFLKEIFGVGP